MEEFEKQQDVYWKVRDEINALKQDVQEQLDPISYTITDPKEYISILVKLIKLQEKIKAIEGKSEEKLRDLRESLHDLAEQEKIKEKPNFDFTNGAIQDVYRAMNSDWLSLDVQEIIFDLGLPLGVLPELRKLAEKNQNLAESSEEMEMIAKLWWHIDFFVRTREAVFAGNKINPLGRDLNVDETNDHFKIWAILTRHEINRNNEQYNFYWEKSLRDMSVEINETLPMDKQDNDLQEIDRSIKRALKQKSLKPFVKSKGFQLADK